jgi:hypothetical protein
MRIVVLHMSAQVAHIAPQRSMPSMPLIDPEHIVQACSHALAASMRRCIAAVSNVIAVSMPGIAPIDSFIIPMSIASSV